MSRTFFSFLEKSFHLIRELVIFSDMDETENKFLQKVDLDALQKRNDTRSIIREEIVQIISDMRAKGEL